MRDVFLFNNTKKSHINGKRTPNRIEGNYTESKNAIASCTFKIKPNNPGFNQLLEYITLVQIKNNDVPEFLGRVILIIPKVDENGEICKEVTCESVLGFLKDSVAYTYNLEGYSRSQIVIKLIEHHNSHVEDKKAFSIIDAPQYDYSSLDYTWNKDYNTFEALTIEEMLLGGYFYRVSYDGNNSLKYLNNDKDVSKTKIKLGLNMKSLAVTTNFDELVTRLYPYTSNGGSLLSPPEVTELYVDAGTPINVYGVIAKSHTFENVTNVNQLKTLANEYLTKNSTMKQTVEVNCMDLAEYGITPEQFEVGKWYTIECKQLEYTDTLELTQLTRDINEPWNVQLTFGEKKYKATGYR